MRKGSLKTARERTAQTPTRKRLVKTKGAATVGLTFRMSREAWREIHEMAFTGNVSINGLLYDALNEYRERRGLPPLLPVPTKKELEPDQGD